MTEKWIEIKIISNPSVLEEISSYLFALGADGLQENTQDFTVYFPAEAWSPEVFQMLHAILLAHAPTADIRTSEIQRENWNERWKENFKPFRLTENCAIVPDWEADFDSGKARKIIISPKMAFGTGHHETTQLILQLLEKWLKAGDKVLDAGTGSAILAIYAALLGAGQVLAFDNDPVAIENAEENVALNAQTHCIKTKVATLEQVPQTPYDLILANINRNVLEQLAPNFAAYGHAKTRLVLSGLLISDRGQIQSAFSENGWALLDEAAKGEWMAMVFKRNMD